MSNIRRVISEKDSPLTWRQIKQKKDYVDSCLTYEILLQDSGLAEKPTDDWNTFVPKEDDLALIGKDEYIFRGGKWDKK